jgi:hypothetical protein
MWIRYAWLVIATAAVVAWWMVVQRMDQYINIFCDYRKAIP